MVSYNLAKKCRICSSQNLELILDLGKQPPANSLLEINQLEISNTEYKNGLQNLTDEYLHEQVKTGVSTIEIKDTNFCALKVKDTIPSNIWNAETKQFYISYEW